MFRCGPLGTLSESENTNRVLRGLLFGFVVLAIILALSFLKERVQLRRDICGGRPALVIPFNLLSGSHSNRFSLAVAFGATAGSCIKMFLDALARGNLTAWTGFDSTWAKVFHGIVMVMVYGIICYPFFACLMTEYKMVGAVLGLIYTVMRFIPLFVEIFGCTRPTTNDQRLYTTNEINLREFFIQLPVVLCHLFLIVRFAFLLYKELRQKYWLNAGDIHQRKVSTSACITKQHNTIHVRLLLRNQLLSYSSAYTLPLYIKLRDRIYQTRPDFKFSTQVISTLVVAGIILYQITMATMLYLATITAVLKVYFGGAQRFWKVLNDCLYVSFIFSGSFAIIQMLHFLKCHREHVLTSYRTTLSLRMAPSRLVSRSLSFSGYQIAYIAWGVINVDLVLIIVSFIIAGIDTIPLLKKSLEYYLLELMPLLFFSVMVWIFQYLLGMLVFRDRQFPDVTVTIDNLRLFGVFSYFFFFFNILVGLFSSTFRILKSLILGLVFLSRIDCTPLMKGYETWDKVFYVPSGTTIVSLSITAQLLRMVRARAHLSYIGFIHVLKTFSHPVMLVFCQLLLDRHNKEENVDDGGQPGEIGTGHSSAVKEGTPTYIADKHARNRWFLAITLLRNPGLAKYRKRKASMIREEASLDHVEAIVF